MTNLFLGFLNRSLSAAVLIFAVVLVRLAFKKAPKWLWVGALVFLGFHPVNRRRCVFCARSRLKAC